MKTRCRRWTRWVTMDPAYRLRDLCQMARSHGLQVIDAHRPGLCMWEGLALFGSSEAMRALEADWDGRRLRWYRSRPSGAWPVSVDRPRDRWAEQTVNWEQP